MLQEYFNYLSVFSVFTVAELKVVLCVGCRAFSLGLTFVCELCCRRKGAQTTLGVPAAAVAALELRWKVSQEGEASRTGKECGEFPVPKALLLWKEAD